MEVKIASPKKIRDARRPHLDLPPCMVCGGKASGIHYGVNTCQGCKVFFQRSLRRDVPFECKKSGKCKIIDSNRGNCPACRILKCHAVGMSREGIRMGRYTLTERTLKINEVKKLKAENSEITTPLSQNINIIDAEMTGTEYSLSESEVSPASSDNRHCMSTSSLSPNLPQRELISVLAKKKKGFDKGDIVLTKMEFGVWWPCYVHSQESPTEIKVGFWNENTICDAYCNRSTSIDEGDLALRSELTDFEKHLLESQELVEIRGKTGRGVPLIIPNETKNALQSLTNAAFRAEGGVKKDNPYVFANTGATVIRAGDALDDVKRRPDLKLENPETIFANNLRKQTATIAQALSLDDAQLKWVCNHLGHTVRVHEQYYRQTSGLIERIDIAKLMLIQENNLVGKFHNKTLSEIQFDDIEDVAERELETTQRTADVRDNVLLEDDMDDEFGVTSINNKKAKKDSESVGDKSISPPESQQFSDSGYDDARKGSESTNSNSRKDKFCIITDVLRKEMALLQNSKSSHLEGPNENGSSPESQLASDQKEAPSTTRVGRDSCIVNHDRTSELPSNAGNGRQMSQKISKELCDLDISNKKSHLSTCPEVVLLTKEEETFLYKITEAFRSMTIEPDLTDDDIKLRLKEAYTTYQYKTQLFGQMKALSMEEYKQVRKETGLDVDGRIALVNQWTAKEREYIENYVHFAHVIPGFSSLPFKDQVALIKSALYDFDLFTNCRGIDPDLEMIWMNTGQIYHLNEVCMFDTEEICKDYCEMCRKIQAMRLTFTELALLVCVCLTFRDRCRLISPNQVEEIQLDLVRLLRKVFLQTRRDAKKAGTCFVQIMNIFISCRDLSENVNKNWLKLSKDEFIQEIIPDIETYLNVE